MGTNLSTVTQNYYAKLFDLRIISKVASEERQISGLGQDTSCPYKCSYRLTVGQYQFTFASNRFTLANYVFARANYLILDTGCYIPDTGCPLPDAGYQLPDKSIKWNSSTFNHSFIQPIIHSRGGQASIQ